MVTKGGATTSETRKNKNKKPNAIINILNEGYLFHDEGIA
jgi:hypothetical protein